ncbi:hypothetical protein PRZ48_001638 [Zasmidium cellare]|uniref:DUF7587 domain-containing protein n=1 Tax=Zasmidium cellare TaxID=395010 RepID=A0ABR0F351_ZASCE|nr:hypothetical protein PRZ48_001638 [Zasmidium cellare]
MPSTKASQGKGKIVWTRDLKLCLHLMHTDFDIQRAQRVQVFNIVFERYLTGCGLTEGAASNTIESQYGERRKPTTRDWPSICQPPTTTADFEAREVLTERIRDALSTLKSTGGRRPAKSTRVTPATAPERSRRASAVAGPSTFRAAVAEASYQPPATPSRASRTSAMVVISTPTSKAIAAQLPTPTKSKSKSPRKRQDPSPKVAVPRYDGSTFAVSPEVAAKVGTEVKQVPQLVAHPPLPALLFRSVVSVTLKKNSEKGFWARKYYKCNVRPSQPPKSIHLDMADVFKLLIKELNVNEESGRLSVIDTSKLDRRAVFYARPFHDEICKVYAFSNGAHRYKGTYEYLVWRDVPEEAMLYTFKAKDLLSYVSRHASLENALRLHILREPRLSSANKRAEMTRDKMSLTTDLAAGLSHLCISLGLDAHSPVEHLSHIVMDVIDGWALQVDRREREEWWALATVFERNLSKRSAKPITEKERVCIRFAFLDGVAWGSGEVNARHKTERIAKKGRQAARIGLADPAKIVTDILDATKLAVQSYSAMETRRLNNYHERRQLTIEAGPSTVMNVSDDDEGDDDEDDDDFAWDVDEEMPDVLPDDEEQIRYDDED